MPIYSISSPLYTTAQTLSAPTIYSSFANRAFYPRYTYPPPANSLGAIVEKIKTSTPTLKSMILLAPSSCAGWSPVPGYNAILIGLTLYEVQKYRASTSWTSSAILALKARLAWGGKSGVLSLDSYSLNFNYVTWIP